jgi:hypothetical protein
MDLSNLKEINQVKADKAISDQRHQDVIASTAQVSSTVLSATSSLIKYLEGHTTRTEVVNQLRSINTPDAFKVVAAVDALHETLKTHENTDLTEITKVMQDILDETKKIPKELPKEQEQQFVDYTKQFKALEDAVKAVEKVVKEQELVAEAPVVNVPETNVQVDAPDLKPLQTSIKDVVKAVQAIVIPEYKTDNKAVEKLVKESNVFLKKILEKPIGGGGGGGGQAWTAVNPSGTPMPLNLDGSGNLLVSGGGSSGTQYADGAARGTATGTLAMVDDGTNIQSLSGDSTGKLNVNSISGTVSLPTGAATAAAQTDKSQFTKLTDGTDTALITAAGEQNVIATAQPGVDIGDVTINNAAGASAVNIQDGGNSITVDQATGTNLHTVVDSGTITSITNAIPVTTTTTSTHSNVANSITSVTLLALNTSRKSATIYNDDTAASLYVKFGTTASATSFKIKIAPGGYYEFPLPIYTGRVDGIATAATGSARICEET